ncbi:protein YAE1 homolog [Choloepus didactylus]|uniref:protein YAE1 homolog n=1 Tax=Choloepus didactylus TaxID=27675 RepID=UPI0018A024D4|nr:protein YAE1 homolog [Choloepus didactylus]
MSWLQASFLVPGPGNEGDVFDEEADESSLVQREWRSQMRRRVKEGYRDGIDAGKAVALQQGFNQGYKEGAEVIINYGQLRGTLSALLSWCHLHDNSSALINKINNLLDAVGQCEEYVLRNLKSVMPQPHVVDLLDSIEDMDLCHVVPVGKKIDGAKDERLCENNAEFNKNCSKSPSGMDCSYLECCRTQEHAHSENPSLTWILEQTASLVKQLGISVDVLQHLKQL